MNYNMFSYFRINDIHSTYKIHYELMVHYYSLDKWYTSDVVLSKNHFEIVETCPKEHTYYS